MRRTTFHTIKVVPVVTEKRKPGRQFLDEEKNKTVKQYSIAIEVNALFWDKP
jgi:hypothetical protein